MVFSLIPRELKFFDLFDELTGIVSRTALKFRDLIDHFDRLTERAYEIRQEEHACQLVVQRLSIAAEQSFITPFDRENILGLATALYVIADNIEETAARFEVFRIERPTAEAAVLGRIIQDCCSHLAEAIHLVRDLSQAERIVGHVEEINRLEREGDRICRERDSVLFANPPEILELIKWRELYASLRNTVKACRAAALAVAEIVIKGA